MKNIYRDNDAEGMPFTRDVKECMENSNYILYRGGFVGQSLYYLFCRKTEKTFYIGSFISNILSEETNSLDKIVNLFVLYSLDNIKFPIRILRDE